MSKSSSKMLRVTSVLLIVIGAIGFQSMMMLLFIAFFLNEFYIHLLNIDVRYLFLNYYTFVTMILLVFDVFVGIMGIACKKPKIINILAILLLVFALLATANNIITSGITIFSWSLIIPWVLPVLFFIGYRKAYDI